MCFCSDVITMVEEKRNEKKQTNNNSTRIPLALTYNKTSRQVCICFIVNDFGSTFGMYYIPSILCTSAIVLAESFTLDTSR